MSTSSALTKSARGEKPWILGSEGVQKRTPSFPCAPAKPAPAVSLTFSFSSLNSQTKPQIADSGAGAEAMPAEFQVLRRSIEA
ncbi:hypothetical protein MCOR25_000080 [Pyricularia grisea]|nr:hypothetical protein MCOR25_000080 [Pyricularia grisea]